MVGLRLGDPSEEKKKAEKERGGKPGAKTTRNVSIDATRLGNLRQISTRGDARAQARQRSESNALNAWPIMSGSAPLQSGMHLKMGKT